MRKVRHPIHLNTMSRELRKRYVSFSQTIYYAGCSSGTRLNSTIARFACWIRSVHHQSLYLAHSAGLHYALFPPFADSMPYFY